MRCSMKCALPAPAKQLKLAGASGIDEI